MELYLFIFTVVSLLLKLNFLCVPLAIMHVANTNPNESHMSQQTLLKTLHVFGHPFCESPLVSMNNAIPVSTFSFPILCAFVFKG